MRKKKKQERGDNSKALTLAKALKSQDPTLRITEGKSQLDKHADAIRELGKRAVADILEVGRRLCEAKKLLPHGKWQEWLQREFGWTDDTARNFMRVHELSENSKTRNFRDLKIAPSALYLLTQRNTPPQVREKIIERAEAGETIGFQTVKTARKVAQQQPAQQDQGPASEQPASEQPVSEQPASEQPASEQPASEQPAKPEEEEDFPFRDARGWFAGVQNDAHRAMQYGYPAEKHVAPDVLRRVLPNPEQFVALLRRAAKGYITLADKLERVLGLPPPPPSEDKPIA